MPEQLPSEKEFLSKLREIIEQNCSNEQFGVSELSREIGMSRSNLLRRVKKLTNRSVSQLIRQVRLAKARKILLETDLSVSEISYLVGFSSVSYFIKCFREYYSYPPGETKKHAALHSHEEMYHLTSQDVKPMFKIIWAALLVILVGGAISVFTYLAVKDQKPGRKAIAVLPFNNESNDSSNVYLINGLMESVLTKLQQIDKLDVVSRTSVEKYRGSKSSAKEIGLKLGVDYLIEGSGQKIGGDILVHVQLIDARTDKHLWAEEYQRQTVDIFKLQQEIAQSIVANTEVIVTPEETSEMEKKPTENLLAYDYFLKGLEQFYRETEAGLRAAIPLFKQAVATDPTFARAHADIAIAYYLLDRNQADKQYTQLVNQYADKAMFYDDHLAQSLLAKAFYYLEVGEYDLAEPYLNKAYKLNSNSTAVINSLSDFYTNYKPNTGKYLEFALKGIRIDIAANDSTSASFIYLHLANAFIQNGFIGEAMTSVEKSLSYQPQNLYSRYVKAYIVYAENNNLKQLKQSLIQTFRQDSSRIDIMQEVGKICYYLRDYREAFRYYDWFLNIKQASNLNIYRSEDVKIAKVFQEVGDNERAQKLMSTYVDYAENDHSIYKNLSLAVYFANSGEPQKAIEHLKLFAEQDNFHLWTILFLKIDPLMDPIKNNPEFKKIYRSIEVKFQQHHKALQKQLESKGLI